VAVLGHLEEEGARSSVVEHTSLLDMIRYRKFKCGIVQKKTSVSDSDPNPDPHWIRNQKGENQPKKGRKN
jgi:hypothetical protein